MSLHDDIAKLPEWPDKNLMTIDYYPDAMEAALARLRLARKWIEQEDTHGASCSTNAPIAFPCDCGRDALLAAMEEPK